jgi:hypothetical protein
VTPGAALRARREALGQTLAEVASATRIPLEHLRAIEADKMDALPAGPYASAYVAALEEHLGVTVTVEPAPPPPLTGPPLRFVRWIALTSLAAMVAAIGWQVAASRGASLPAVPAEPPAPVRDQHLVVTTRRTVDLAVTVDGEERLRRQVPGGQTLTFDAFDRIEVAVPAVDAVRLEHNGRLIVPQGRQDHPRTLVFVDDAGAGA